MIPKTQSDAHHTCFYGSQYSAVLCEAKRSLFFPFEFLPPSTGKRADTHDTHYLFLFAFLLQRTLTYDLMKIRSHLISLLHQDSHGLINSAPPTFVEHFVRSGDLGANSSILRDAWRLETVVRVSFFAM